MSASRKPAPAFSGQHASQSLDAMKQEAKHCQRCDIFRLGTNSVFGEGSVNAKVVFVGEQPGHQEDIEGRPFVGPAGQLFDACLNEAGIDRSTCYVTNAVKRFKFEQRGKRRLHSKPNAGEIRRCAWWLGGEIDRIRPALLVALGASASFSLFGRGIKITRDRGRLLETPWAIPALLTIHPSLLLRLRDRQEAEHQRKAFVSDLARIKPYI